MSQFNNTDAERGGVLTEGGPRAGLFFARNHFTWLAYLMLACFAYLQAAPGPLMPFLRRELGLSYTEGAYHFSAFALGAVIAGLVGDSLADCFGRRVIFWGGALGMSLSAVALVVSRMLVLTVGTVFLMGLLGTLLLVVQQAGLADQHGSHRAVAISEANVAASLSATLAPLTIGGLQQAGPGWRVGLLIPVVATILVAIFYRRTPFPPVTRGTPGETHNSRRLPMIYWAFWLVIVLGVAAEWSMVFWGAEFLINVTGFGTATAATMMSLFFLAMVSGRFSGSRLARRIDTNTLLPGSLLIALSGTLLFWLSPLRGLTLVGLFVAGLGIANIYPLTLAAATGVSPGAADAASARIAVGAGLAVFSAPFIVGFAADRVDLRSAFTLVIFLLAAGLIAAALTARRLSKLS